MDLGAIIKAPTEDEQWIKKILLMGVFSLIPIVGPFNLLGYVKAAYEARKAGGKELPEAGLGYIGAGFWIFVAFLPLVGLVIAAMIVVAILVTIMFKISPSLGRIVALLGPLLQLLLAVVITAVSPAVLYLHVAKGERWASLKVGAIIALIQANVGRYAMLWVAFFVGGIIGGVGGIACGFGMIFTMPFGYAIHAMALYEFDKLQDQSTPAVVSET